MAEKEALPLWPAIFPADASEGSASFLLAAGKKALPAYRSASPSAFKSFKSLASKREALQSDRSASSPKLPIRGKRFTLSRPSFLLAFYSEALRLEHGGNGEALLFFTPTVGPGAGQIQGEALPSWNPIIRKRFVLTTQPEALLLGETIVGVKTKRFVLQRHWNLAAGQPEALQLGKAFTSWTTPPSEALPFC